MVAPSLGHLEYLLDHHRLAVRMRNGNLWAIRRNGRTQTWKTRPGHFRIPIKAGLRVYDELTHESTIERQGEGSNLEFVIMEQPRW